MCKILFQYPSDVDPCFSQVRLRCADVDAQHIRDVFVLIVLHHIQVEHHAVRRGQLLHGFQHILRIQLLGFFLHHAYLVLLLTQASQYMILFCNKELMLLPPEAVNGIIDENAPHPTLERAIELVLAHVSEELDEALLYKVHGTVTVAFVPHAQDQHLSKEHLVHPLLTSAVLPQTTLNQSPQFIVSGLHAVHLTGGLL